MAAGRGAAKLGREDSAIVSATLTTKPKGMTHWSCRSWRRSGGEQVDGARIWQRHELQPHRVETFKLSRDGKFVEKLTDVVGLYLNPPQQAMVLCVDEKSQIQASIARNRDCR